MLGVTTTTAEEPYGRLTEASSREVLVTLARKGARRFLTAALGVVEVDARELGRVLEDGDVTWHTEQPRGRFAETSSRGVLVTLARKGARRFLTVALGPADVDGGDVGRVLEDGNVTWNTSAARKVRGNVVKRGTGPIVLAHALKQPPARAKRHGGSISPPALAIKSPTA